jgi:AcrR family transcriptional regulator
MATRASSRPYRKLERARREEETRRRITEAAVELHGTLGPANTTLTEVAKLAGVSRMTVYNHFPTEAELFVACSTHWAAHNPFPDPATWTAIADPSERLISGLTELYAWYGLKQDMLGNVLRDAAIMPSLAEIMDDLWATYMDALVQTLAQGWPVGRAASEADADTEAESGVEALQATLRLAVSFDTWRVLTDSGLDDAQAAALAARMVIGAIG